MNKKVLYLCPEITYPENTGGKVAFANHLKILNLIYGDNLTAAFFDVDSDRSETNLQAIYGLKHVKIFRRTIAKATGALSYLKSGLHFFTNRMPRAFLVRENSEFIAFVEAAISAKEFDVIYFDHFSSFRFLKELPKRPTHLFKYIAHNIEHKVLYDQFTSSRNLLKQVYFYVEYLKMKFLEKRIFNCVGEVLTISSNDEMYIKRNYTYLAARNIPEIVKLKDARWRFHDEKNIVFVGGTNYFPNYDAVDWIVKKLYPALISKESDIKITIIGNSENYLSENKDIPSQIYFTGIVSDEDLNSYFLKSNLFLCPIKLGSGIKIKVLTALSDATPILCTKESTLGIDYINLVEFVFDRDNLTETVKKVLLIINSQTKQQEMSNYISELLESEYESILAKWAL